MTNSLGFQSTGFARLNNMLNTGIVSQVCGDAGSDFYTVKGLIYWFRTGSETMLRDAMNIEAKLESCYERA